MKEKKEIKKTKSKEILREIEALSESLEQFNKLKKEIEAIKEKLKGFVGDKDGINCDGKWLVEIRRELQNRFESGKELEKKLLSFEMNPEDFKYKREIVKVMEPKLLK